MCGNKKKGFVHIKCNSIVKKFSMERVRQLGIDVGLAQLYINLSKDGSTSSKRDASVVRLAERLIKLIPGIRPRILMTTADINDMTLFITKWKERLSDMMQTRQYVPVYYSDIVNGLLLGKSDIKCTSIHLGWCLSILGSKNMKPSKIADMILKHQSKEWDDLLPLAYDDYYSVRLTDSSEETQADFREKIEFIYRLSIPSTSDSLISQIENDIKVVTEMKQLCNNAPANYRELIKDYLQLLNRLQTISQSILPKKFIKKLEGILYQKEDNHSNTSNDTIHQKLKDSAIKSDDTVPSNNNTSHGMSPAIHDSSKNDFCSPSLMFTPDDNYNEKEDPSDYPSEVPGEPGEDEFNYEELMDYLDEKLKNDSSGREKIKNAMDIVYAFCKLEDFAKRFTQLRTMIDSGTVKWPGGFAVGEMKKMLNPDYVPNIR